MKRNKSNLKKLKKYNVSIFFVASAAIVILFISGIITLLSHIFNVRELLSIYVDKDLDWFVLLTFITSSVVIGLIVSYIFGNIITIPLNSIVRGMVSLSEGNYDVEINLGKRSVLKDLSECFNRLSKELKKNEMLSSDFVNNFSHEIKTPLVSITGLISLLKNPDLPEEKRMEYLDIIDEEANRLASLTTNILSLSKIESQSIAPNQESFNISEQIRNCVLLLEKKWERKNITPILDFEEYIISANNDMMKQVWLNLLDNAIKFSPNDSEIEIDIQKENRTLKIEIINEHSGIKEEDLEKIFSKFYQVDSDKKAEGNGIGLSIVKKIIVLPSMKKPAAEKPLRTVHREEMSPVLGAAARGTSSSGISISAPISKSTAK